MRITKGQPIFRIFECVTTKALMGDHSSQAKEAYDVKSGNEVVSGGRHIRVWRYFLADLSDLSVTKG